MKELISIIVPVYNTEIYLRECIQSVIEQSYKEWELILVDDGSTDASGEICDEYKKNIRIRVIHQKNGGQSCARNAALRICRGKYYVFLDSDDRLSCNALEILYTGIRESGAGICCGGIHTFGSGKEKDVHMFESSYLMDAEDACKKMFLQEELDSNTVAKIYDASLWENVEFPEGTIFEDVPIMYKIILKSKKVMYCNECVYEQRAREGSTTSSEFTASRMIYTKYTKEVYQNISHRYPKLEEAGKIYYIYSVIDNFIHLSCSKNVNKYRSYWKELKKEIFYNRKLIISHQLFRDRLLRTTCCYLGFGRIALKLVRLLNKKNKNCFKKREEVQWKAD